MQSCTRRNFLKASATVAGGIALGQRSAQIAGATSARAGKAATLVWTNRWGKGNDTHVNGMNYVFSSFKAQHPEITIKEVVLPAGPDVQKDLSDCQAGGCPDLMNDITSTFYDDGYLLDLTPYLNADPSWKAGFDQQALAFNRSNGHQWGLCDELSPMDLIWNTKILDAAKISSIPTTWSQFLAVCDKIKAAGYQPMTWTGLGGGGGGHFFHNLVAGQPGGLQALAASKFDAPQITAAFTALKTFVDNKWVAPNEVEVSYGEGLASFEADRVGCYINGMWTIKNDITGTGISPALRKHVAFSPVPGLKGGLVVENKVATSLGISAAVKKDPAKLAAAITFVKYLFSEPVAAKWIPLTTSPMGVVVPLKSVPNLDPLPKAFLAARDRATKVFSLPSTPAMQAQQWADATTALQTLLIGKGVDAAQTAYVQYLKKYAS